MSLIDVQPSTSLEPIPTNGIGTCSGPVTPAVVAVRKYRCGFPVCGSPRRHGSAFGRWAVSGYCVVKSADH